jgi:hypothetical protein
LVFVLERVGLVPCPLFYFLGEGRVSRKGAEGAKEVLGGRGRAALAKDAKGAKEEQGGWEGRVHAKALRG